MRKCSPEIRIAVLVWLAAPLAGCSIPVTQPDFMSSTFNASEIDMIYVMPPLEYLTTDQGQLDQVIWKGARMTLKARDYDFTCVKDRAAVTGVPRDAFSDPNSAILAGIGPSEARWVLFLVLYKKPRRSQQIGPAGEDGRALVLNMDVVSPTLSAYLFDRLKGRVVWSNTKGTAYGVLSGTIQAVAGLPKKNK